MSPKFRLKLAATEEEKRDIYRLRYDIFVKELGFKIPNVTPKTGIEETTDQICQLIIGYDGNTLAGTVAYDSWKDVPFTEQSIRHYCLESFVEAFSRESIAIIRKALIAKPYRGSTLFPEMVSFLYRLSVDMGIYFCFTDCSPYLVNFYERIGFRRYAPHFYYDDTKILAVPLVFLINDLEHLRRIGSPLLKDAKEKKAVDHPASRIHLESQWISPVVRFDETETLGLPELPERPVAPLTISETDLFKDIPEGDIKYVLDNSKINSYASRQVIISETDTSMDLFLLTEGYAEVTQKKKNRYVALATLGPGDLFGEINFFTRSKRSANVVALTPCKVLQIPEVLFQKIKAAKPTTGCQLYHNLASILAERVKLTSRWVSKSPPL